MPTPRPPRFMDPDNSEFWEFTQEKELRIQKCTQCSELRWPPATTCNNCLSDEYEWALMSGRGTALSWIVFERGYFSEYPAPHPAVVVELEEGPLFICTMPPGQNPDDLLEDGSPMVLDWLDGEDRFGEYNLPVFRPA